MIESSAAHNGEAMSATVLSELLWLAMKNSGKGQDYSTDRSIATSWLLRKYRLCSAVTATKCTFRFLSSKNYLL
jgi:hypothetical protein